MLSRIEGLRVENCDIQADSSHSPAIRRIVSDRSANVVFHGHREHFKYDFYGIHRGQEDRLTFIGPNGRLIDADFIDCRMDSPTWGARIQQQFTTSLAQSLVIPPGVAHIFSHLEGVYTLNTYVTYLPEPNAWLSGEIEWSVNSDTINIPRGVADDILPKINVNALRASALFYRLTAQNVSENLDGIVPEYPVTQRLSLDDSTAPLLRFSKAAKRSPIPKFEPIYGIPGLGWSRRLYVVGGGTSDGGFTVQPGPSDYSVRACALDHHVISEVAEHCAQRITLFGEDDRSATCTVTDGAQSVTFDFPPSPFRDLHIPQGCTFELRRMVGMIAMVTKLQ